MGKWIDYNPGTGLKETNVYDEQTGLLTVCKSEDVEPLLDRNKEAQNTRATDIGIKKGLWHYASIPMTVQYELLTKYGLSVFNKHHRPQIIEKINSEYPYLKTTTKHHSMRRKKPKTGQTSKPPGPYVIVR
jgi:hypothetical protein